MRNSYRVGTVLATAVLGCMTVYSPVLANSPEVRDSIKTTTSNSRTKPSDIKPCNPGGPGGNMCALTIDACDNAGGGLYNTPDGTIECH